MMRVNGNNHDEQPLYSSFKSPPPSYFSTSNTIYTSLPSNTTQTYTNGEGLAKTYINKFENDPTISNNSVSNHNKVRRSYSSNKFESLPATSISPRLSSKFPRYFNSYGRSDLTAAATSLQSSSNDDSPTKDYGYSSGSLPTSSLEHSSNTEICFTKSSPSSKYSSLPSTAKPTDESCGHIGRPGSPLFSSFAPTTFSSRFENSAPNSYRSSINSPKLGGSPCNSFDSTKSSSSSFLKLARLNLTPVKFRAKKLTALESPRKDPDPETPAELSTSIAPIATPALPAVADTSAIASDLGAEACALEPTEAEAEANAGSGDGASSTGSESRKAATAFTIELDKEDDGELSAKKLDIGGPLSKWAPKHRRNLSLTKVEENKKVEERGGKPPVHRARSGTVGGGVGGSSSPAAGGVAGLKRPGGYHSEGYFSSDQDEDAPRKNDIRSPRSPRTPELKSPLAGPGAGVAGPGAGVARSASQDFHRQSPTLRKTSIGVRPGEQIRACCKGLEKKPSVADITGRSSRSSSDKGSKASTKIDVQKQENGSTHTNCQPFKVDRLVGDMARDEDEVSEAGTYTIDKDSSPELDKARGDIERVFGLAGEEAYSPTDPHTTHWDANAAGGDKFKTSPSISRSSPNWIQQWAAQVAEQTNAGDISDLGKTTDSNISATTKGGSSIVSPRGSKQSILPSVSGSQDGSDMLRPRRKLPTPPSLLQQSYPPGVSRAPDMAELEEMAKTRLMCGGEELGTDADYPASDTQCFLRDTEDLLTSLQARVTDNTPITSSGGYMITPFEAHDSGGDSDLDTSTSYAIQDERPTAPIRAKLKLSGLDNSQKNIGSSVLSPRTKLDSSASSQYRRERSIMSDGGLRRARLSSEDNSLGATRQTPLTPTERRKQHQPLIRTNSNVNGNAISRRSPASRVGSLPTPADVRTPTSSHQAVVKSPSRSSIKKDSSGIQRKQPSSRSNSTMSSKEVDFQNWKRRKNYDPMRAAKDGRKKQLEKSTPDKTSSGNITSSDRGSPSPPGSLLRSASFHGTEGMLGISNRWPRSAPGRYLQNHNTYTSEDDGPVSYDDEPMPPAPHASPLRRSPTSPHQLHQSTHNSSPSHGAAAARGRRSSYTQSDDSEHMTSSPSRKISLDETGSEGKRSPLSIVGSNASLVAVSRGVGPNAANSGRSRAKIEALDNLVISTIHSLSTKVRGTSENLLQKLKTQYGNEDQDRADLLQNVLNHLNSESESASSQIRSTSRDLSGILKNLKKIQTALEVIDQVMVVGGGDYDDLEDLDWPQNNIGSDY